MHAKTTVAKSPNFKQDRIWLNGKEESITNPRLLNCLREIRKRAKTDESEHVHICSENNFPTAAGLASSAAGYACLVYALCTLYEIKGDFSEIARQGKSLILKEKCQVRLTFVLLHIRQILFHES